MAAQNDAYLSLGSNLGDREANLRSALAALERANVYIVACSSVYESEPQDLKEQPWFLNIVVLIRVNVTPRQLLAIIQRIERQLGREPPSRRIPKGPRLIDIDILLFGQRVVRTPALTLPHPRMGSRRFVLEPLIELNSSVAHPDTGYYYSGRLIALEDQHVRKIRGPLTLE